MAADHGSSAKAIIYAFFANLGIAITKGFAAVYTNSGSMLAEAIHSVADATNQVLLFIGLKQSEKPPTTEYPLGFGKETYFWSFIVAMLLFSIGGLFSIYEGWHKLHEPEPLNQAWVALIVLGLAIVLEAASLIGCLNEIRKVRRGRPFGDWLQAHAQCRAGGRARRGHRGAGGAGAGVRVRLDRRGDRRHALGRRGLDRDRRGADHRRVLHRERGSKGCWSAGRRSPSSSASSKS